MSPGSVDIMVFQIKLVSAAQEALEDISNSNESLENLIFKFRTSESKIASLFVVPLTWDKPEAKMTAIAISSLCRIASHHAYTNELANRLIDILYSYPDLYGLDVQNNIVLINVMQIIASFVTFSDTTVPLHDESLRRALSIGFNISLSKVLSVQKISRAILHQVINTIVDNFWSVMRAKNGEIEVPTYINNYEEIITTKTAANDGDEGDSLLSLKDGTSMDLSERSIDKNDMCYLEDSSNLSIDSLKEEYHKYLSDATKLVGDICSLCVQSPAAWLALDRFDQNFCLEFLENFLRNYAELIKSVAEFTFILNEKIANLICTLLENDEKKEIYFSVLLLRLSVAFVNNFGMECPTHCIRVIGHICDSLAPEVPFWRQVAVLEIMALSSSNNGSFLIDFLSQGLQLKSFSNLKGVLLRFFTQFKNCSDRILSRITASSFVIENVRFKIIDNWTQMDTVPRISRGHVFSLIYKIISGAICYLASNILKNSNFNASFVEFQQGHYFGPSTSILSSLESRNSGFINFCQYNDGKNNEIFEVLIPSITELLSSIFVNTSHDVTFQSCLYHFQLLALTILNLRIEPLSSLIIEVLICFVLPKDFAIQEFVVDDYKFCLKSSLGSNLSNSDSKTAIDVVMPESSYVLFTLSAKNIAAMKVLLNVVHNSISSLKPFYYLIFCVFAHLQGFLSVKCPNDKSVSEDMISLLSDTIEYLANSTISCSEEELYEVFKCLVRHILVQCKQEKNSDSPAIYFTLTQTVSLFTVNFGRISFLLDEFGAFVDEACNYGNRFMIPLITKCVFDNLIFGIGKLNQSEIPKELTTLFLWKNLEIISNVFSTTQCQKLKIYILELVYEIMVKPKNDLFGPIWLMILSIFFDAEIIQNSVLMNIGYSCIQIITREHLGTIPLDCIPFLICFIGDFCRCLLDINISISAINLLEFIGDYLPDMNIKGVSKQDCPKNTVDYRSQVMKLGDMSISLKSIFEKFPILFDKNFEGESFETLWLILFENIFSIMYIKSSIAREFAIQTFYRILSKCTIEVNVWTIVFEKWLLPNLYSTLHKNLTTNESHSNMSELDKDQGADKWFNTQIILISKFTKIFEGYLGHLLDSFPESLFRRTWSTYLECLVDVSNSEDLGVVLAVIASLCNLLKTTYAYEREMRPAVDNDKIGVVSEVQEGIWTNLKQISINLRQNAQVLKYQSLIRPIICIFSELNKFFKVFNSSPNTFEKFLDIVTIFISMPITITREYEMANSSIILLLKEFYEGPDALKSLLFCSVPLTCQIVSILLTCLSKFMNYSYEATCHRSLSELLGRNPKNPKGSFFFKKISISSPNLGHKKLANSCLMALRDVWRVLMIVDKLATMYKVDSNLEHSGVGEAPENGNPSCSTFANLDVLKFVNESLNWPYINDSGHENDSSIATNAVDFVGEDSEVDSPEAKFFFSGISVFEGEEFFGPEFSKFYLMERECAAMADHEWCKMWIEEHPRSFEIINRIFPDFCLIVGMLMQMEYSCVNGQFWGDLFELFLGCTKFSLGVMTFDWISEKSIGGDYDGYTALDEDVDENVDYLVAIAIERVEDKGTIDFDVRGGIPYFENRLIQGWIFCTKLVENFLCEKKKVQFNNSLSHCILNAEKSMITLIKEFMLIYCPPLNSLRRWILAILIRGCEYIKREAFMKACCESLFKLTQDGRAAPFVIPYLMSYCKMALKRFINEDKKTSVLPLSVHRVMQVKFILEQLKQLRIEPIYWKTQNSNELLSKSHMGHVWQLFSFLCGCITCREMEIKCLIQKILLDCAQELGIESSDIEIF